MKKVFFLFLVAVAACNSLSKKSPVSASADIDRMMHFDSAQIKVTYLTEESARQFPGTLLLVADLPNGTVAVFNSLPVMHAAFEPTVNQFRHGNVTMLTTGGHTYGIMPKHMFGNDIDLQNALKTQGFKVSDGPSDVIALRLKEKQATLAAEPFEKLEPEKLEGAPCTIRTLNFFEGDSGIREYRIQGKLHYIDPSFQKANEAKATDMFGHKSEGVPTEGLYVMRVPQSLFWEILGMSGGSVTVNVDGQERFLGTNNFRLTPIIMSGKDTTALVMMVVQPVLKKDLPTD